MEPNCIECNCMKPYRVTAGCALEAYCFHPSIPDQDRVWQNMEKKSVTEPHSRKIACSYMRSEGYPCGPEGKLWEPKDA